MLLRIYDIKTNKREHSVSHIECLPRNYLVHSFIANECHFLISITKEVRKNKKITMYLRTFKMKTLLFIIIFPPLFLK